MSIKVMTEVWDSSSAKGSARLVLLSLADHANDEGYCYPSIARLARKSVLSERNVQLVLGELEARGELVRLLGTGRGHVNQYWVLPPDTVSRLTGEGRTVKTFHPFAALEQRVKNQGERVQTDAQRVKDSPERVMPASPRTIKNQNQPSRPITPDEIEKNNSESNSASPAHQTRTLEGANQNSSADRTVLGTANGLEKSSAPRPFSLEARERQSNEVEPNRSTDRIGNQLEPAGNQRQGRFNDPYARYR